MNLPSALLLCFALLVGPTRVLAHRFEPALLDLREFAPGRFEVRWKLAPGIRAGAAGVGRDLRPRLPATCHRIGEAADDPGATAAPAYWRVDCGEAGLVGQRIGVDGLDRTLLDAVIRLRWRDGRSVTGILRPGNDAFVVPGSNAPARRLLAGYVKLGISHILFGADHLLFVLALFLLVNSWGVLVRTITAFTVSHSVTLALAVLGFVHVSPPLVDALVALSILVLAADLASAANEWPTLTRRFPWIVAGAFGLLHGLGFAGALTGLGLPAARVPVALLSFNIGVEIGQLIFVAVLVAPVRRLSRLRLAGIGGNTVCAYAIGTVAAAWTIGRVLRLVAH